VDLVVLLLAGLAALAAHPQARYGSPLASNCVCALLDLEIAPLSGKVKCRCSDSRFDSTNEPGQFLVWSPPIHGELLKLGIEIAPATVGKYLRRRRNPPSQTWRTLLTNHRKQTVSMDFFSAFQRRRSLVGEGFTQIVVGWI